MWKNKSCKDVSLFMLLLQVIGYFSGVMFLIVVLYLQAWAQELGGEVGRDALN